MQFGNNWSDKLMPVDGGIATLMIWDQLHFEYTWEIMGEKMAPGLLVRQIEAFYTWTGSACVALIGRSVRVFVCDEYHKVEKFVWMVKMTVAMYVLWNIDLFLVLSFRDPTVSPDQR